MACPDTGTYSRPTLGRLLCVRLPRNSLAALVPHLHDRTAQLIPRDTAALRLLMSYIRVLDDNQALATPELRHLIVTHIHDLAALVLIPQRTISPPWNHAACVQRACARSSPSF